MKDFIAERKLMYSIKGSDLRKEFSVRISMPYPIEAQMVAFPIGTGCFGCDVSIVSLDEKGLVVYGADSLQAINIASNVEPLLRNLLKKYDIYWLSGEPYFDNPMND